MKTSDYKFGGVANINGILVPKMRGSKQGQVMRDRTKYCRKAKHQGRNEW